MSYSLDANILLDASNGTSPWHEPAKNFLASCMEDEELLLLTWPVLMAYLRISTHPSIFDEPLSQSQAESNVTTLLGQPQVYLISENEEFWQIYREIGKTLPIRGNLVMDARIAALLRQAEVPRIYTRDQDFDAFDFLTSLHPYEAGDRDSDQPPD